MYTSIFCSLIVFHPWYPVEGYAIRGSTFGYSPSGIVLENITCSGLESTLSACPYSPFGLIAAPQCRSPFTNAAGVICEVEQGNVDTLLITSGLPFIAIWRCAVISLVVLTKLLFPSSRHPTSYQWRWQWRRQFFAPIWYRLWRSNFAAGRWRLVPCDHAQHFVCLLWLQLHQSLRKPFSTATQTWLHLSSMYLHV